LVSTAQQARLALLAWTGLLEAQALSDLMELLARLALLVWTEQLAQADHRAGQLEQEQTLSSS